jgi:hypothetical protein
MKTIAMQWEEFRSKVMPANAPKVQVTEMQRAFYCGAYSFLAEMTSSLESGEDATDADVANIENAKLEMEAFFAHLVAPTRRPS